MAKDPLSKKRRASVPEQDSAKLKKPKKTTAEDAAAPAKKRKATEDAAPVTLKKSKTPKSTSELASKASKKEPTSQNSDKTNGESLKLKNDQRVAKKINGAKEKSAAIAKKDLILPKPIDEEEDDGQMADEESEASDVDDQTEALLKGFESDGDDADHMNEEGLEEGQPVPALELDKKKKKQLKKALATESVNPGTVYVGRIPHGFYEKEMKEYFEQFGKILKIRLSRNPKNGASRHYAFVQFESDAVADVVARTMDGYLMFNHILKVKLIPDEQVRDDLFKGANKRFKKVPWNKIRGRELQLGASEATWDKRKGREEKRREAKSEKLKAIGYEFEAPVIKSAKGLAKKPEEPIVLENGEEEPKTIDGAPASGESSEPKKRKAKKAKPAQKSEVVSEKVETAAVIATADKTTKSQPKAKKEKKGNPEPAAAKETEKTLKTKESKTGLADEAAAGGEKKESKNNKMVKSSA